MKAKRIWFILRHTGHSTYGGGWSEEKDWECYIFPFGDNSYPKPYLYGKGVYRCRAIRHALTQGLLKLLYAIEKRIG